MKKNKLLVQLLFIISIFLIQPGNAFAACNQRQLNKVCNTCKQQGLNSCQVCSQCQVCPQFDENFSRLKNKYNIQVKFADETFLYQIELLTRPDTRRIFTYNATTINALGARTVIGQNLNGYISFDTIVFGLPGTLIKTLPTLLPSGVLSCFGYYKANGTDDVIQGRCNLIRGLSTDLSIIDPSLFPIVELTPALN